MHHLSQEIRWRLEEITTGLFLVWLAPLGQNSSRVTFLWEQTGLLIFKMLRSRNICRFSNSHSWTETFLQTDRQQRSLDSFYHPRLGKGESPQSGSCKYQSGKSFIFLHGLINQDSYSDVTTGRKVFLPETL